MKTLRKADMMQKDQVRFPFAMLGRQLSFFDMSGADQSTFSLYTMHSIASTCKGRKRCSGRIEFAMDRSTLLLIPRSPVLIPHHGVFTWWRLDDHVDKVRYVFRRHDKVLYGRMYSCDRVCTQNGVCA